MLGGENEVLTELLAGGRWVGLVLLCLLAVVHVLVCS